MKREFLLNILFLLSINFLIKPFYIFGIDRTVQNRVGLEDYGLYATLFSFTFLFQIINDFGLQQFNSRNIAQHHQLLPKYFPNMLVLKVGLGIIYAFIIVLVAIIIGYGSRQFSLLFLFWQTVLRFFVQFVYFFSYLLLSSQTALGYCLSFLESV